MTGQCRDGVEMMEESKDFRLKIIESLRGRLLAERAASKAAKEEACNQAKRLEELQRRLAEEIKRRKRAQKRLNQALKKMEYLELMDERRTKSGSVVMVDSAQPQCGSLEEVEEMAVSIGSRDLIADDDDDEPLLMENDNGFDSQELSTDALRKTCSEDSKETAIDKAVTEDCKQALIPGCEQLNSEACKPQKKHKVKYVLFAPLRGLLLCSTGRRKARISSSKEPLAGQGDSD